MRLLSFDTSTQDIFLAVSEDGRLVHERVVAAAQSDGSMRQQAVAMLIPSIEAVMRDLDWSRASIDCLVVGQGPGSFTGIRVAVVTARTLAQALGLPLIGLSYLDCLADAAERPAAVVLAAHAKHYYVAGYKQGTLTPSVGPLYATEAELPALIEQFDHVLADEESRRALAASTEALPILKNIAATQLKIAWDRLSLTMSGGKVDKKDLAEVFPYSRIEPLYLRGASVTVKKSNG